MHNRFDLYDWSVRRGMLLIGILLAITVIGVLRLPLWGVLVASVLVLLLLLLPPMRRIIPFFCLVIILIGLWRGVLYRIYTVDPMMQAVGNTDTIEAVVEERPRSGHMYTVRITSSSSLPIGTHILLYCSDSVAPSLYDSVSATVEFKELYSTQLYKRAHGVYLQAFPTTFDDSSVLSVSSDERTLLTALRPFRIRMTESLTELLGDKIGGLLAAVCLGDRSVTDAQVDDAFRASGLSHLLSVSGLHMSVLVGGMLLVIRIVKMKRLYGNLIAVLAIFLFMWLVEFTPSVTRAGVMYLVILIGQMTRYQSDALNSLGLALTAIILVSPSSVYDVGLWLSFAATLGILCITPRIAAPLLAQIEELPSVLRTVLQWLIGSLSVSVGCTLPVTPILMFVFGELSLISPLTNIFAVLPAGWMTVLGCLGAILSVIPCIGFIGKGLLLLAGLLAKWLVFIADLCAAIPGAVLRPSAWWVIILFAGSGVILSAAFLCLPPRRVCYILCALLSAFIIALPLDTALSRDAVTVAVAADDYGTVVIAQYDHETIVLANQAGSLYTAYGLLEEMRITEPQLLVIGSSQTRHESYIADWQYAYPSLTVISVGEKDTANLSDELIVRGDCVSFWNNSVLDVLTDDWWRFSIGDTQMLMAMSQQARSPSDLSGDAVIIYTTSVSTGHTVCADTILRVCESDSELPIDTEGIQIITEDQPYYMITVGDGIWRRTWW